MQATFPQLLLKHAAERPDAPAMREKEYGIWQTLSWRDMVTLVEQIAGGLHQAGLRRRVDDRAHDQQGKRRFRRQRHIARRIQDEHFVAALQGLNLLRRPLHEQDVADTEDLNWVYNQGGTQSVFAIEGFVNKTSTGSATVPGRNSRCCSTPVAPSSTGTHAPRRAGSRCSRACPPKPGSRSTPTTRPHGGSRRADGCAWARARGAMRLDSGFCPTTGGVGPPPAVGTPRPATLVPDPEPKDKYPWLDADPRPAGWPTDFNGWKK